MKKKISNLMLAAILTICGTIALTSCTSEIDNPVVPVQPEEPMEQDVSKYSVDQIAATVQGCSVDPVMFVFTNQVRLYDIDADGSCDVYDLTLNEEDDPSDEDVNVIAYKGTWQVTNDLRRLHFVDALDLEGYDLMGGLMLQTEMQFDEGSKFKALGGGVEVKDTLAVLRDTEDGELLFIDRNDADFLAYLSEAGLIQDSGNARTRAENSPLSNSEIEKKIKEIVGNENYRHLLQPILRFSNIDLSDWMGEFYKGLNPRICDMTIPGSHLSLSYLERESNYESLSFSRLQFLNLEKQWANGVRFFDFGSFCISGNKVEPFSFEPMAGYGEDDLKTHLGTLKNLLKAHPNETAIIMFDRYLSDQNYFSPVYEILNLLPDKGKLIYERLQSELKDILVMDYAPGIRLNDCRGKVLIMNRHDEDVEGCPLGLNLRDAWPPATTGNEAVISFPNGEKGKVYVQALKNYYVEGKAAPKEKLDAVDRAWDYAKRMTGSAEPVWVINYAAGCLINPQPAQNTSPEYMNSPYNAFYLNPHVERLIANQVGDNKGGIILFDFVGKNGRQCRDSEFDCNGFAAPVYTTINNFFLVKHHKISLDEGDLVK